VAGDHDPSPLLERIVAPVLAIDAADDERNPPENGLMERERKRLKSARDVLIPASGQTRAMPPRPAPAGGRPSSRTRCGACRGAGASARGRDGQRRRARPPVRC
jgi:hypothetical protein